MGQDTVNKKEILDRVIPVIEQISMRLNLLPLEISFVQEGGRWFLRIFIFSHDHPITHVDCEAVTRELNEHLEQLIPINYNLEVSSPGAERKLKSSREYEIFKGKKVKIKLKQPLVAGGEREFSAKIVEYQKEGVLKVETTENKKELNIIEANISTIKLCLE